MTREGIGNTTVKWIVIDGLERDPSYMVQRPVKSLWVDKIADNFDPDLIGVILVSQRTDGSRIIIDGQHRVLALKKLGWNGQKVPCEVVSGLTRAEEARLFLGRSTTKTVSSVDKFMVRLTAEDPVALQISRISQEEGFTIGPVPSATNICAVRSLENIYTGKGALIERDHPDALQRSLKVTREAWGSQGERTSGTAIAGVGLFYLRYLKQIDDARLINKLARIAGGTAGLIARGKGRQRSDGGSLVQGLANHLLDLYNTGLRGKKRITK